MPETTNEQDVNAPGTIASGGTYSNRINPCGAVAATTGPAAGETPATPFPGESGKTPEARPAGSARPRTLRTRRHGKVTRIRKAKLPGVHPPRGTFEAADILAGEGYLVGRMQGRDAAFDLVGQSPEGSILVRIVRPKSPVANAREVRELYEKDIRAIQPFCRAPSDNIQFWVFSREAGLLRYRVYDWGIGNVSTMQKIFKEKSITASDKKSTNIERSNQRARNSPCPTGQSG
jgi:hypothetical protein